MIVRLAFNNSTYEADLSKPLDISLPIRQGADNPTCYYADPVSFETIVAGSFVGSVQLGGSVNYQKVLITPHGNGTHTECFGHLSSDPSATINSLLTSYHFIAELVSVAPTLLPDGDFMVRLDDIKSKISGLPVKALVIRTLPNGADKKVRQYSGTNPPYLESSIGSFCVSSGIDHLLVDLPSVDREVDGGKLATHKYFWNVDGLTRKGATISELIFVDNAIEDGVYLLNLQIASFEMDASPSKPILYRLRESVN